MDNLVRRATTGTIYAFLGSYAVTAINFIAGIILARILLPSHFGVFALAIFYLTVFSVLKDWGAESAILYRQDKEEETTSTLFFLQVALSVLAIVLALISSFLLKKIYDPQVVSILLVLAIFALVEALGAIPRTLLEKKIEFKTLSVLEASATFIAAAAAIFLAWQGFGVWALVVQRISLISLKTAGFWFTSRFRPIFAIDKQILSWFFKNFGLPIFLSSLASVFLFQFDNFLIGTFVGAVFLGYYSKAFQFATLPTQLITQVISRVAFPVYAKCQDDREKLAKAFTIFLKGIWRLSLPMAVGLFVLASDIIKLLIGEKWLPAVPLLRILAGYSLARILLDGTGPLFSGGLGKPKIRTKIAIIQAILLVFFASIGVYFWRGTGVALAVDLVMLSGVFLSYQQIQRDLKLNLGEIFLAPTLAVLGTLIVSTIIIYIIIVRSLFLTLIIRGILLCLVYFGLLLALEGSKLKKEAIVLLKYVRQK
ncbi:MAG: lipopolysaccharide biosynthesis protein [Candidatus Cloacimonetes bacterium]|nr:lipopolysaccharide biosynthesis protein [Candidatus Cloacimonadota bacterium]